METGCPPFRGWVLWCALLWPCWGLSPVPGHAQEPVEREAGELSLGPRGFSLGLGVRRMSQADDLVSPLRYSGVSWGVTLGVSFPSAATLRRVDLSYANPRLTSSITREGSHLQRGHWVELRAPIFHRAADLRSGNLSLFLGGALTARFSLYEHWYRKSESERWVNLFGLVEPGGAWHLRLPGGAEVWQEVTVPLAGLVVRPPYHGFTEVPSPDWEGPGAVKGIHHSLHYWRSVAGGRRGGITYSFQGFRYPDPRPLASARHTLRLNVVLWGGPP